MRVIGHEFYADVFSVEVTATEFVEKGWKIMPDGRIDDWCGGDPAWGSKAPIGADTGEFWIILHEADTRSFRHATEAAAVNEAERLAALPGSEHRKFYVLRPVKVSKVEGREHHPPALRSSDCGATVRILRHPGHEGRGKWALTVNDHNANNWISPKDMRQIGAWLHQEADRIEKPVVRTREVFDLEAGF